MKKLLFAVILGSCAGFANSAAIPLNEIESYSNDYQNGPAVQNGLNDAFDFYGEATGFNGLKVERTVSTHNSILSYSIFDTFTNDTDKDLVTSITYSVGLGSDGGLIYQYQNEDQTEGFITAFSEMHNSNNSAQSYDPALAFLIGNNDWTWDSEAELTPEYNLTSATSTGYIWTYDFTIKAFESISLLNFVTVYQSQTDPDYMNDLQSAYNISESLFYGTSGLTELDDLYKNAINFTVPVSVSEPPMLVLSALIFAGLMRRRVKG